MKYICMYVCMEHIWLEEIFIVLTWLETHRHAYPCTHKLVCMCTHACKHMHPYTHMLVCMCAHLHTCTPHTYFFARAHAYTWHALVSTHTRLFAHVCILTHMLVCMHTHLHMHIDIHPCTQSCFPMHTRTHACAHTLMHISACTHIHMLVHTCAHMHNTSPKFPGDLLDERIGGGLVMYDLLTM